MTTQDTQDTQQDITRDHLIGLTMVWADRGGPWAFERGRRHG